MTSFYGGPNGQSFSIDQVFESKIQLMADLQSRLSSSLSVGSFVFISYGLPGTDKFNLNKSNDKKEYGQTYNSTLWQKIYIENTPKDKTLLSGIQVEYAAGDYGLGYRLITSCTGNTPKFQVKTISTEANVLPDIQISYNETDVDAPVLTFSIPYSYKFDTTNKIAVTSLASDQNPWVTLTPVSSNDPRTLKFAFGLPLAQTIAAAQLEESVGSAEDPEVRLAIGPTSAYPNDPGSVTNPVLMIKLPKAQLLKIADSVDQLKPGSKPEVKLDDSNKNSPVLTFRLPTTQTMKDPETTVENSETSPSVESIGDSYYTQLRFHLPKTAKYYYGSLLGKKSQTTYSLAKETSGMPNVIAVGDYYVNEPTGFVYKVSAVSTSQVTFVYQACLQAPMPQITTNWISPFDFSKTGDDKRNTANIVQSYQDTTEQTGQSLQFNLPKTSNFVVNKPTLNGPLQRDSSGVLLTVRDNDTMQFDFTLAEGTQFFTGKGEPGTISSARPGDMYISDVDGEIYQLNLNKKWISTGSSIQGPIGNPLNIVYNVTYTSDIVEKDTLEAVSAQLAKDYGKTPESTDILAVVYESSSGETISYWYFYTNGKWGRVQLSGDVSNFIRNVKTEDADNKTYSITYINNLETSLKDSISTNAGNISTNAANITATNNKITNLESAIETKISWGSFSDLT